MMTQCIDLIQNASKKLSCRFWISARFLTRSLGSRTGIKKQMIVKPIQMPKNWVETYFEDGQLGFWSRQMFNHAPVSIFVSAGFVLYSLLSIAIYGITCIYVQYTCTRAIFVQYFEIIYFQVIVYGISIKCISSNISRAAGRTCRLIKLYSQS